MKAGKIVHASGVTPQPPVQTPAHSDGIEDLMDATALSGMNTLVAQTSAE